MRRILFALLFFIPILAFSQSRASRTKLAEYQTKNVFQIDGEFVKVQRSEVGVKATKEELYAKVKQYLEQAYSDHNSKLKIENKNGGVLEVESVSFSFFSYTANSTIPVNHHVFYTMRVYVEDNKLEVICSAKEWLAEWSTIGNGFKVEGYPIVECIPLGEKTFFSNRGMTVEALLALVDELHSVAEDLEKNIVK